MASTHRRLSGAAAPDGSPIEVYRLLPPLGEAEVIHAAVRRASELLELGCGAGRITHRLVELGHPVTAVDESPEMLRHVRGAETVLADIETLDLGRRFAGVVLASNLINAVDGRKRHAFLTTCARHVTGAGSVLIQRYPPEWDPSLHGTDEKLGAVRLRLLGGRREGHLVHGVIEYEAGGRTWKHRFDGYVLDDGELEDSLALAGLVFRRHLDERRSWVEAGLPPRTRVS